MERRRQRRSSTICAPANTDDGTLARARSRRHQHQGGGHLRRCVGQRRRPRLRPAARRRRTRAADRARQPRRRRCRGDRSMGTGRWRRGRRARAVPRRDRDDRVPSQPARRVAGRTGDRSAGDRARCAGLDHQRRPRLHARRVAGRRRAPATRPSPPWSSAPASEAASWSTAHCTSGGWAAPASCRTR